MSAMPQQRRRMRSVNPFRHSSRPVVTGQSTYARTCSRLFQIERAKRASGLTPDSTAQSVHAERYFFAYIRQ